MGRTPELPGMGTGQLPGNTDAGWEAWMGEKQEEAGMLLSSCTDDVGLVPSRSRGRNFSVNWD